MQTSSPPSAGFPAMARRRRLCYAAQETGAAQPTGKARETPLLLDDFAIFHYGPVSKFAYSGVFHYGPVSKFAYSG